MKSTLVLFAVAVALFLALVPSKASAGVRIYVGPGYDYGHRYHYPPYRYYYPRYRYRYYPRYRYRNYPRGYFDYPRRRAWRRWY